MLSPGVIARRSVPSDQVFALDCTWTILESVIVFSFVDT